MIDRDGIRVWVGAEGKALKRGPTCASLDEALGRAYRLASDYTVRIEVAVGQWHVFEETHNTLLGPGFAPEVAASLAVTLAPPSLAAPATPRLRAPTEAPAPQSERRRAPRVASPLPDSAAEKVTCRRHPARLIDVSWTGARVETHTPTPPHAGEVLALEVRAFDTVAQLAGHIRWVRDGQCGLEFDHALMTRGATVLLERMLAKR